MKIKKRYKISLLALVLGLFTAAISVDHFEISKNLDIFATAYKKLNKHYVSETEPAVLMKAAINGMLQSLDPYTVFYPEESINDAKIISSGEYAGIGVSIVKRDSLLMITDVYANSPAKKAGLKVGDFLIRIADVDMIGKSTDDARILLNGQEGSEVAMTIHRGPVERSPKSFKFQREKISIEDVSHSGFLNQSDIGYIKLESFTQDASQKVKKAFEEMRKQKALKGLILDLRGNGGGLLVEAVHIVNMFIPKDLPVVITRGKTEDRTIVYKTKGQPIDLDLPLVILVDQRSASASEIVAGAIQDYDRGVVVGQKSFGKGLVQNVVPLSYKTSMKITVAKYYIPSGRCIQSVDYLENEQREGMKETEINAFKTRNGRTVYDAGGIIPDVHVAPLKAKKEMQTLFSPFSVFDYSTLYALEHDSIEQAGSFRLNEKEMIAFEQYLAQQTNGKDDTKLNYSLSQLNKQALNSGLNLENETENLLQIIKEKRRHWIKKNEALIRTELEKEILRRYFGRQAGVEYGLSNDPDVNKSLELINSPADYQKILGN